MAAVRIPSIDVAAADFAGAALAFIIHDDAVVRVGEPDRPVGADHQVIRGIQPPSIMRVGDHTDGPVMFGAGHAAGQMLAGQQPPGAVIGVSVAFMNSTSASACFFISNQS